ncbi:MAG TPA: lysophospholipid acyltransferase family protein [Actinomycetota bacterium]|nr:lysophospholipid acyltransferase family protein [Actinomycetota bacterium]
MRVAIRPVYYAGHMRATDEEIDIWWRIGLRTVGRLYWGALRLRYAGLERIPRQGSAIFAMNHVSVLDPIALALATASRGRAIRFLAGAEFFEHPVWGPGLRVTGQIPVWRGIRDLAALDELIAELRRGGLAGIFPEGRIGAGTGRLRGRSGVTRVARAAGVPVIPVGLWGTQARWPLDGLKILPFRRLPVAASIGDPIQVRSTHDTTALREDTRRIMTAIEGLVAKARAAVENAAPIPETAPDAGLGRAGRS